MLPRGRELEQAMNDYVLYHRASDPVRSESGPQLLELGAWTIV